MLELLVVLLVIGALWVVAYPTIRSVREDPPVPTAPTPLLAAAVGDAEPDAPTATTTALLPGAAGTGDACYLLRIGPQGGTTTPVACP